MTDYSITTSGKPTFGSVVGSPAHAILRGPMDLTEPSAIELGFYGWAALALQAQPAYNPPNGESRIVYVDLYAEDQSTAILRAVSLDWRKTRALFDSQGNDFHLVLPARFVWLDRELVLTWLAAFYGINVPIKNDFAEHDRSDIRQIRIVPDFQDAAFEKTWEIEDESYRPLTQVWTQVWAQMTDALETAPIVSAVEEDYGLVNVQPAYDFDAYRPRWFPMKSQLGSR